MKNLNLHVIKNGVEKDVIYHVDQIFVDEHFGKLYIDSWGLQTSIRLNHLKDYQFILRFDD